MNYINNYQIDDLDGEIWKPIKGYNNKYFISNLARVKSLKRHQATILRQRQNSSGYYRVELWKNGKRKPVSVSRLVAIAFVPNDDPLYKTTVHHINEDKSLNLPENLQWLSLSDNIRAHYANQNIEK